MRRVAPLLLVVFLAGLGPVARAEAITVQPVGAVLARAPLHLELTFEDIAPGAEARVLLDGRAIHEFRVDGAAMTLRIETAELGSGRHEIRVRAAGSEAVAPLRVIPGWLSIVPPLLAIVLALLIKDVVISLFLAVFSGALILYAWNPLTAFARSIDSIVVPAIADADKIKILVFSMLLGGMAGLLTKSGGTQGIVERLRHYATTARRGQVATWLMGVVIFFDDYANTLIVGSTMRPITDRLRVSREKLAYIVDSTAAPVASLFPISTWIGFEVGLIAAAFAELGLQFNPYATFVASIPFRFYPVFALVLGFTIAFACRDFGPMLRAELRASHTGQLVAEGDKPLADYSSSLLAPPAGAPRRARNALLPIAAVIGVTVIGLYVSGASQLASADYPTRLGWIQAVFSNANSLDVLLWASLSAATLALVLPVVQRILTLREAMEGLIEGFKSMLLAVVVLVLAWSIGSVTGLLHTADYVVGLTAGVLSPHWVPVLVFVMSAAISFASGTSWGTMAILMPLVIPIADKLSIAAGHGASSEVYHVLMLGTISSVLAGSVWGDHCSPISDTTILSSMASGCDHIAHVRTQMPYALGIGLLGMLLGDIPTAFGLSPWISLFAGSAIIVAAVLFFGRRSDWHPARAGG